jgi:hypothetical protein
VCSVVCVTGVSEISVLLVFLNSPVMLSVGVSEQACSVACVAGVPEQCCSVVCVTGVSKISVLLVFLNSPVMLSVGVSEQACSVRRLRFMLLMRPVSDTQSATSVPSASLNSLYWARHCPLAQVAQHMFTSPRVGVFRSDLLC